MLSDWIHWLSQKHPEQMVMYLWAFLLLDGPRYALSKIVMCLWDCGVGCWRWLHGAYPDLSYSYCPTVCVIVAGYNEEKNLEAPLRSIQGTYPKLEIIVVDDGSTDKTYEVALRYARENPGVKVLRIPNRSGKSPAMNIALTYTQAEVIIGLDADAELGPNAIWEVIQPLKDPKVGVVSGTILGRNPFVNFCTWFQAYEFLHCVFVGRLFLARLGILGIASGAFSAFNRVALDQGFGFDEGSSLDLDNTLRLRKSGWKIAFAPYAECYTDMLTSWNMLKNQRMRWDRTITIRNQGRKHIDIAYFWSKNFQWLNFVVWFESIFFSLICMWGIVAWAIWFCVFLPEDWWQILFTLYICYLGFEVVQCVAALCYTNHPRRDAIVSLIFPLVPFFQLYLMGIRLVATTQEIFVRRSYSEKFTPDRIRGATWHW